MNFNGLILVTPFLKRQFTITIQFFVTRNLPTTCEKFVNISIFFCSKGATENSCIVFGNPEETLALVFEVICQKLELRASSRVPNTEKQMKARGLVLSSVSRCLEPVMKHEARVFDMSSQMKQ